MPILRCPQCNVRSHVQQVPKSLPKCTVPKCKQKQVALVVESVNDPQATSTRLTYKGLTYTLPVQLQGSTFWVRLGGLNVTDKDLAVYQKAVQNGFLSPKSTGESGIKKETDGYYYVKVDYNTAKSNNMDNVVSPCAQLWQVGSWRLLDFDTLAKRHWGH